MFGRPKAANGLFLSQEVGRGMEIIAQTLSREHPNATPVDFQALAVWIYSVLLHLIMALGRTDRISLENVSYSFGSVMSEAPPEDRWSLDKYAEEIEQCQNLLIAHVGSNNWQGFREAARLYYQRHTSVIEKQAIPEQEFVRLGSTVAMAWVERLRQSGHIKL